MEAAASVVGIVSFGLSLAKTLQAFIDSVIEAEETITLIVAEVNATASTLKRLQDFIDQDKSASQEQHRPTVLNDTGIKEISACALQCEKIYLQIIILIEKACMQVGEDGSDNIGSQGPSAEDPDTPAVRLAVFSKNVNKLGRKMRWPWLEPRIKRCQEHLGRLKVSLMLSLQVFLIAESRARPSVVRIFGTDEQDDLRDKAEILLKKMTELRAKEISPKQPNRQQRGLDNGASEVIDVASSANNVFTTSVNLPNTTSSRGLASYSTYSFGYEGGHRPRGSRRPRKSRFTRALRVFKTHFWKRIERKAAFKKDSTSVVYEAYLIYPPTGPQPGENSSPLPMKLPFGHSRLTLEVKRALRKCDPWEILLILSPHHRLLVDNVVQQVQLAATGNTNVCLIAIDVDGYSEADVSGLHAGDLQWTRMVLFFRHEVVRARKETTENKTDVAGKQPRFAAIIHRIFSGGQRKRKKRLELQASPRREAEEQLRKEAKNKADRENIEKDKADLEETKKTLEAERIRIEEEKKEVENRHRNLKDAEEVAVKDIEKGTDEEGLENMAEAERAKKKATEEKTAAEKATLPLKFRDTDGRKFNFPFHLVQTWEGMEDLIKQAFLHTEMFGPSVQQGHYDLIGPEGGIILPSFWSATIKPGDSVSMRVRWPPRDSTQRYDPGYQSGHSADRSRPYRERSHSRRLSPSPSHRGRDDRDSSRERSRDDQTPRKWPPSNDKARARTRSPTPIAAASDAESVDLSDLEYELLGMERPEKKMASSAKRTRQSPQPGSSFQGGTLGRGPTPEPPPEGQPDRRGSFGTLTTEPEHLSRSGTGSLHGSQSTKGGVFRKLSAKVFTRGSTRSSGSDSRGTGPRISDMELDDDLTENTPTVPYPAPMYGEMPPMFPLQDPLHPRREAAPTYPPMQAPGLPRPPPGDPAMEPVMVQKRAQMRKKAWDFFSRSRPRKQGRIPMSFSKALESHDTGVLEDVGKGEDIGDIDKELGLDDLEGTEQMAAKDIDELLETWTNVGGAT